MDLAFILVGVWRVDSAVSAEENDGVVVFREIAFWTLLVRILEDAEVA
jgi:hypothetical protein